MITMDTLRKVAVRNGERLGGTAGAVFRVGRIRNGRAVDLAEGA